MAGDLRPDPRPDPRAVTLAATVSAVLFSVAFLDLPLRALAAAQEPAMRGFWRALTRVGESGWMLAVAGAVLALALLARARVRGARWRRGLATAAQIAGFALAAVGLLGLLAAGLKLTIGRPRPKMFEQVGAFDLSPLAFDFKLNSFPSGHATTVFALAATLALLAPRWRPLILAAGGWAAFSRVPAGAHYLSDVLAGSALGYYGARALARRAAARGLAFERDLTPARGREPAAALRLAWRRMAAPALSGLGRTIHDRRRSALRRDRADEERGRGGGGAG